MKKRASAVALALWAAAPLSGQAPEAKPTPVPFYRQYLVPGNKLDDQILEQERRVQENPGDANLRNDFGNLLAARRFPEQAAEQYEKALELDKKNFIAAYNLGLLRETEGKVSAAMSAYKRSIKRKPGFPPSHFRLGRLYEHAGDLDDAVQQYAQAMRIDPTMRDPRRNPLVVDSELIYRASLENYRRDVAVASMGDESVFVEEARFRRVPTDRAVSSEEVSSGEDREPGPRDVGAPVPQGVSDASRPPAGARAPRPAPAPGTMGSELGGRPKPAPPARAKAPQTTQVSAPETAPAPAPGIEPGLPEEEAEPEPGAQPTPTPGPPSEDEPS